MICENELLFDACFERPDVHLTASFSVSPGELIAVAGDIGSGKSTLCRLIAGMERIDDGLIRFGSTVWDQPEPSCFVDAGSRGVGYMSQDFRSGIDPTQSPMGALCSVTTEVEAERLLTGLSLGEHIVRRKMSTLSGGEAQRAYLAYTIATRPQVLLLDEPFAALDIHTNHMVHAWLDGWLGETGVPTIIVTQNRDDHDHFVDRVIDLTDASLV